MLAYLMLPGQQAIFIHPSGHFLAKYPDELGDELLYVVETDDGRQRTLSAEEFAQEFGWENDPTQVQVLPPPDDDGG